MFVSLSEYNLSRNEIENLIFQWIFSERDRQIAKRRFLDGIRYEKLAEEFDLSTQQTKTIIRKVKDELIKHI